MDTVAVFHPERQQSEFEPKVRSLSDATSDYLSISKFVRSSSVPLVGERSARNAFKYQDRPLVVVYYDVNFEPLHAKVGCYISSTYTCEGTSIFTLL